MDTSHMIRQVEVFKNSLKVIDSVYSFVTSIPLFQLYIGDLAPNSLEFTIRICGTSYCFCVYVDFDQNYSLICDNSFCVYCYTIDNEHYTGCDVPLNIYTYNYKHELQNYIISCLNKIDKYAVSKRNELYLSTLLKMEAAKSELGITINPRYGCKGFQVKLVSSIPQIERHSLSIVFIKDHVLRHRPNSGIFESALLYDDKLCYKDELGYHDVRIHDYDEFITDLIRFKSILNEKYKI